MIDEQQMQEALSERLQAGRVLDVVSNLETNYSSWKDRITKVDHALANEWAFVWPDSTGHFGEAAIPNFVQLAAEDRARMVSSGRPNTVIRSDRVGDTAKKAAEKRERISTGYWKHSRVPGNYSRWAMDIQAGGVSAVKVWPDLGKPKTERFPLYSRVDPRHLFPAPTFAEGPWLDYAVVAYIEDWQTVWARYKADKSQGQLFMSKSEYGSDTKRVKVIEFYDQGQAAVLACRTGGESKSYTWLIEPATHTLGRCPIVVGVRPGNGEYRGDFDAVLPILSTWNKFMTMELDAAINKVYPATINYDIENPEDYGPDAQLNAVSPQARFEFVAHPSDPYSNVQLLRSIADFARVGSLMSPSRSGDPNESVVSAAGITAAQSQELDHVRSIERDCIAPMLEAANELAFSADEKYCDASKPIPGSSETYRPSADINGAYDNSVTYGFGSGLDEINRNVMILQQWAGGQGLMSEQTAMDQLPSIEDPTRERKQIALEQVERATQAGLIADAQQGKLTALQLAAIRKALEDDSKTLYDAILEVTEPQQPAPLAGGPGAMMAGASAKTGMAGAGEAPMPPLSQVLVGGRP